MNTAHARTFVPMNIGLQIEHVWSETGMSQKTFSEKIGVHRNTVKDIFGSVSIDTLVLKKISMALNYNFFDVLGLDFEAARAKKNKTPLSVVREPGVKPSPIRVIVEMDSTDPNSRAIAADLVERLQTGRKPK